MPPVPPPVQKPSLIGAWLALAFFGLAVPAVMVVSASAHVPPETLEARCRAAWRVSDFPQYAVTGYVFGYPQKFGRTNSVNEARMTVRDMGDPALAWDARPYVRLQCRLDNLGRVRLIGG